MISRFCGLIFVVVLGLTCSMGKAAAVERVRMVTNLGNIDVVLFDDVAPVTVANFFAYIKAGRYANTLIHRSVAGFIIQGGGYRLGSGELGLVPEYDPIVNEFHLSNLRGTIAMAKLPDDPDSATSEWFFNLADNSANLDFQNGGFTVFGEATAPSLAVIDAIASQPVYNATSIGWPFTQLPLIGGQYLVVVLDIIQAGDIDNDKNVGLADAVCGLQLISGIPGRTPALGSEINNDGKIGIEDVIYVLQYIARFR